MGFLSVDNERKLWRIFGAKRAGGKLKIEVGWQKLKLGTVEKRKTRTGGEMMVVKFRKPPVAIEGLRTKMAYHTIDCYHILKGNSHKSKPCDFEENWFKSFTTCLDEKPFTALKKGTYYWCLVSQEEKLIKKQNKIIRYEKGEDFGKPIVMVDCEIKEIHPEDYDVSREEVNYFELYKFLNN